MNRPSLSGSRRSEAGQISLFIIGLSLVLLMTAAVVVDASAVYLQRQGLATVADGAALTGADGGAAGSFVTGIPDERLMPQAHEAHAAVAEYLRATGAYDRYPGLQHQVQVDVTQRAVHVTLRARVDLPLHLPGGPRSAEVLATSRAAVAVRR